MVASSTQLEPTTLLHSQTNPFSPSDAQYLESFLTIHFAFLDGIFSSLFARASDKQYVLNPSFSLLLSHQRHRCSLLTSFIRFNTPANVFQFLKKKSFFLSLLRSLDGIALFLRVVKETENIVVPLVKEMRIHLDMIDLYMSEEKEEDGEQRKQALLFNLTHLLNNVADLNPVRKDLVDSNKEDFFLCLLRAVLSREQKRERRIFLSIGLALSSQATDDFVLFVLSLLKKHSLLGLLLKSESEEEEDALVIALLTNLLIIREAALMFEESGLIPYLEQRLHTTKQRAILLSLVSFFSNLIFLNNSTAASFRSSPVSGKRLYFNPCY